MLRRHPNYICYIRILIGTYVRARTLSGHVYTIYCLGRLPERLFAFIYFYVLHWVVTLHWTLCMPMGHGLCPCLQCKTPRTPVRHKLQMRLIKFCILHHNRNTMLPPFCRNLILASLHCQFQLTLSRFCNKISLSKNPTFQQRTENFLYAAKI